MAGYLPAFVTRLQEIKKLYKAEKYSEEVAKAIREKIVSAVKSDIVEVLLVLKAIMLVRHVDRTIREKSIRAIK